MEALDVAAMSRMAAQLSGCLKAGCVQEEVAGLSRSVFPEALLLRCVLCLLVFLLRP